MGTIPLWTTYKDMSYFYTPQLKYPLDGYKVNSLDFGVHGIFKGVDWGIHLGEDILKPADTAVWSIGCGKVVYSALHPGNKSYGNWGNIIIVAHKNPTSKKIFYVVYGHLGKRCKKKGDKVKFNEKIGIVGKSHTEENGWWVPHLHFGIYIGPWKGVVLPGYYKKEQGRTKLKHWKNPSKFIKRYANTISKIRKYFVYIVRCADNTLYTGITTNVNRRISEHNDNKKGSKYTRARQPVKAVYLTEFFNRSQATKEESRIKKLNRKEKELLIKK